MLRSVHVVFHAGCVPCMLCAVHVVFRACCVLCMLHAVHVVFRACCVLCMLCSMHVVCCACCVPCTLCAVHVACCASIIMINMEVDYFLTQVLQHSKIEFRYFSTYSHIYFISKGSTIMLICNLSVKLLLGKKRISQ